ncbi:hypothetical protein GF337_03765 [candidate division KSB1 bacterium]|nr:hypothetical protein [candidate division KSB1 bacterium]
MFKKVFLLSVIVLTIAYSGCSKRSIVNYDLVKNNSLVSIEMNSGASYEGIVKLKKPEFIVLNMARDRNNHKKIERQQINQIKASPPVFDYQKNVISEWEINDKKGTKNTWLYTVGGAGLSFGASFFAGSLVHRGMSESENRDEALWAITGTGTLIGTAIFLNTGRKRDREAAIMQIRERRYELAKKEMDQKKNKRKQITTELEKEKKQRAKQQAEMKRLMERIKKREKAGNEREN